MGGRTTGAQKVELDELCATCDVVSLHAPPLPATHHMITGAAQLALLRDGATLINTGRGPLVDHDALIAELEAKRIYAVLDVTDPEPLPDASPLHHTPVFLTPHLAGSGTELKLNAGVAIDDSPLVSRTTRLNEVSQHQLDRLA
ncbi:MAG: NAD(P)-dependent oxidoreductase [Acidimicrobiales bacterium]